MSQPPTPYARAWSFTDFSVSNPTTPHQGQKIDLELNNVLVSLNATISRLNEVQRDDGKVRQSAIDMVPLLDALTPVVTAESVTLVTNTGLSQVTAINLAGATQLAAVNASGAATIAAIDAAINSTNAQTAINASNAAANQAGIATTASFSAQNWASLSFDYKNVAETHKNMAGTYASQAQGHANAAWSAASQASGHAAQAALEVSYANQHANNADTSKMVALDAAATAQAAAASATTIVNAAAAGIINDVQGYVNDASTYASNASSSASSASASASSAATSATNASGFADDADVSATIAQSNATIATTQATAAAGSASLASTSASNASTSASSATTSASNASTSASNALASKNAAATSEANALSYKNSAQSASVAASNYATSASGDATAAANSASAASASASNASTSEINAAASATAAAASAASITPFDGGTVNNAVTAPGLTITSGSGGVLTFSDGTTLSTAPTGGGGGGGSGTLSISSGQLYDNNTANFVTDLTLTGTLTAGTVAGGVVTLNGTGITLATGSGAVINFADGSFQSSAGVDNASLTATLNNYLPLAGGTMTNKLTLAAVPASSSSRFNIPHGQTPVVFTNGDVWTTTAGFFTRINGVTQQLVPTTGATFTGKVTLPTPTTASAPLNIVPGAEVSSSVTGDIWLTSTQNFRFKVGTSTFTAAKVESANSFTGRQSFNQASLSEAPMRIVGQTTNPSVPGNGDISYNTTTSVNQIVGRANGMFSAMSACRAFASFNGTTAPSFPGGTSTVSRTNGSTTCTVTTTTAHGLAVGNTVYALTGVTAGSYTIVSVPTTTSFTFTTVQTTALSAVQITFALNTIRSSFNVSSVTDVSTGQYVVNFTSPLVDTNYAAVASASTPGTSYGAASTAGTSTAGVVVYTFTNTGFGSSTLADHTNVNVAVFR